MKNAKLMLAALVFVGASITSCKKNDTSAPTITLYGDKTVTIDLHQSYTDAGAAATDSKDGNLSSLIMVSGLPDVNNAGIYTITYSVSDKSGNNSKETRTVIVRHTAATTAGNFSVKDSCGSTSTSYVDVVSQNNVTRCSVTRFANYDNAIIYFDISGETNSTISVPQQTVIAGTVPVTRVFSGSGSISSNGKRLIINYTEITNNTTRSCSGVYAKP